MIELEDKWFWAYPTESVDCDGITGSAQEVYSKSDADAVITYLQNQLSLARTGLIKLLAKAQHEARHNKYKRCLATANWCAAECVVNQNIYKKYFTHKSEFRIEHFRKWYFRLLELAEKFKESK